jgi:hypothetical protein
MKLWTYAEASQKIERDLDLQEEKFITPSELMGIFNDAIDEAEQSVLGLFEDYLLCEKQYVLVPGKDRYSLPDDIYANKIRYLWFNDGRTRYQIKRVRVDTLPFADLPCIAYTFQVQHRDPDEGVTIKLYPSVSDSGAYLNLQYIRNANRITDDSSVIDLPEAMNFIFAYVKARVYAKETNPLLQVAMSDLEAQRGFLQSTLKSMTVDDDNEIIPDMSFYYEMN